MSLPTKFKKDKFFRYAGDRRLDGKKMEVVSILNAIMDNSLFSWGLERNKFDCKAGPNDDMVIFIELKLL